MVNFEGSHQPPSQYTLKKYSIVYLKFFGFFLLINCHIIESYYSIVLLGHLFELFSYLFSRINT